MNRQWRRSSLVGPLILIALGALFLLNNLGLVNWDIWLILLRLWPLVLIAIGLDILIGRRSMLGSIAVLVIIVILVVGGVWLVGSQTTIGGQPLTSQDLSQTLQGATAADVQLDPTVAALRLGSTQTMNRSDLPSDLLIIGTVATSRDERITRDFQMTGNTALFVLRTAGIPFFPFVGPSGNRAWDLNLTPNVPISLKVSAGVGDSQIDLTGLNVTRLDYSAGVGKAVIILPARGTFQASLSGGIGDVSVRIPASLAARIHVSSGLGGTNVQGDYTRQGDFYVSPGFDTASDRVELNVSGGIGKVTVQEVKSQ